MESTRSEPRQTPTWLIVLFAVITLASCSSSEASKTDAPTQTDAAPDRVTVRSADHSNWPLTMDEGYLTCNDKAIFFHAGGKLYGVNGWASTYAKNRKWECNPISDIQLKGKDISLLFDLAKPLCKSE